MTEKRYFKRMWEEEYYIFDSETISEKVFDEKVEYEDYRAFADSLMGDEVVEKLNELNDENTELHIQNDFLKNENQHMRKLVNENKQLQERNNRQAKQLDNLYTLIEKQDWKIVTGLIQEFQECEEQLQKEWSDYE